MAFQKNVTLELTTQWSGQAEFKKLNQALDASARKSDTAGKKMGFFGKQSKNAAVGVRGFGDAVSRATSLLASLGVAKVLGDIGKAGLELQASERKIKNVGDKYGETAKVFEITSQAARELSLGTKEAQQQFGNLFARLRPMKVPLEDLKTLFFGIQKAAIKLDINVEDVNETINQMSQGLASGVIMWEDLDIVTKRFPPLAEALAKVLGDNGVTGSLRDLASQGVITTEVMIAAAEELNKLENLDPSAMRLYQQALSDLKTELGKEVLPVVTEGIRRLTNLINAFREIPDTVQKAILGIAAFGAASAILAPILFGIVSVLGKIGGALVLMKGILPIIAGTLGAMVPLLGLVKTAFLGLVGVMTGPAGWVAIGVVLTGVIVSMREQIASFVTDTSQVFAELFRSIGQLTAEGGRRVLEFFNETLVAPIQQLWANTVNFFQDTWFNVQSFLGDSFTFITNIFQRLIVTPLANTWDSLISKMKSAFSGFANFVGNILNRVFEGIKSALRSLNILRKAEGSKPVPLASVGNAPVVESLVDSRNPGLSREERAEQRELESQQRSAQRAVQIIDTAPTAQRLIQTAAPINRSSGGGGNNVTVNVETGPVLRQGDQQFVSLDAYMDGVRQAAIAGGRR